MEGSKIQDQKSVANKYVLAIQVANPDSIETTLASFSFDLRGVAVKSTDPDKFVHEHRFGIGYEIQAVVNDRLCEEQVERNFIALMTLAHNNAEEHYEVI